MSREWCVRVARPTDRARLAHFACAVGSRPWELEVEDFVRTQLFAWATDPLAAKNDPRLLLLISKRRTVGVAAHERITLGEGRRQYAATKLEVVALATDWQGRRFSGGERASDVLLSAVLQDVTDRVPPRHARVLAVIHEENVRSIALCARHGLTEEMSKPADQYRRFVTPRR